MGSATLQIILQLVDDASAALQGVSETTEKSLKDIQGQADEVRNTFGLMGAAILGGLGVLATSAADEDTAQSQLTTAIKGGIAAANDSQTATSSLSKEKTNLQQQLQGVNAKLDEYSQKLAAGGASSGTYVSQIASLQTKQAGLKEQLDSVNASLSLVGASTSQIAEQFQNAAERNTNLGFSIADSLASYTNLFRATDSVTESMQANQVAMDLSRATGMDLTSAAKQVELAMEGNGRALKQFGINLKDGLSPGEALVELQQKLAGTAQDYVNTPWGQLDVAKAKSDALSATLGNDLIPVLTNFLQAITPIITKITEWTNAHPKLTTDILLALGAVGLLALAVSGIAAVISAGIAIFLALSTVLGAIGIVVGAVGLPIIALGVLIGVLAYLWFTHWNEIKGGAQVVLDFLSNLFTGWSDNITKLWNTLWGTILGIVNNIMAAISRVTSGVSNIAGGIGGAVGGAFQNVVHAFAAGGIVTGPTLALVGEAGPEAIIPLSAFAGGTGLAGGRGGGSGSIVVNILGGSYLDSGGATMIANAIGKQIAQQLKLKNFN